mgnify:CR=1 FL=1
MTAKVLPPDFDLRLEWLRGRVCCLQQAVSACVSYSGLQPSPTFIGSLVGELYHEARELLPDGQCFDDMEAVFILCPEFKLRDLSTLTILDTAAMLAVMNVALEDFSASSRFGFSR